MIEGDFMQELLGRIFGNKLEKYEAVRYSLPLYLKDGRSFFVVTVCGQSFVIVRFLTTERFNINTLKKQMATYKNSLKESIAYGFDKVSTFQRKSLIENEVPFVALNGQVYLPFIGAYFEKSVKSEETVPEKFTWGAQLLFLLFLYENNAYTKTEAIKRLMVKPMTVTRASRILVEKGLIKEKKRGNEVWMTIAEEDRKAFYVKGERYLINPVHDVIYVPNGRVAGKVPAAGEYSLSLRSDFGYPEYVEYAFYKDDPGIKDMAGIDPSLDASGNLARFQKWRYDPKLFSGNVFEKEMVDPVSLICSLSDVKDERIHKCLEQVKEEIWKWQTTRN